MCGCSQKKKKFMVFCSYEYYTKFATSGQAHTWTNSHGFKMTGRILRQMFILWYLGIVLLAYNLIGLHLWFLGKKSFLFTETELASLENILDKWFPKITRICSSLPQSLQLTFGSNWTSSFRGVALWNIWHRKWYFNDEDISIRSGLFF